jgi:tetratricopeptide (TPR) repeat protein
MMAPRIRCSLLTLSLLIFTSAPALAQGNEPPPDPTSEAGKRAEGKARYERGAEAYSAGRFKDAIELFLQADALAPSAALSFNIARAYEKISDDASALQWYRDFRRRAPDAKNGPEVDERIHALEAALAKKGVQQLTVLSRPLGATVIVDEQPMGVTPFTGQFAPGTHKVVLSLRGYAEAEHKLELPADRAQDLDVPLVPAAKGVAAPADGPVASAAGPGSSNGAAGQAAPSDKPSGPKFGIWPYVTLGAGAAVLGGSLGFELARRRTEDDALNDPTQIGYKDKLDREQSQQTTARVLAVVGGALAVTGGTLLVLQLTSRSSRSDTPAQVGFGCLPAGCNVDVRGRF